MRAFNSQRTMPIGVFYAGLAFSLWGVMPLYFRYIAHVPPGEILAHRIVWSLLFLLALMVVRKQWDWIKPLARSPRVLGVFTISAVLLSSNWLLFIWAVNNNHVIDGSLGYFINPLVNVLLGYTVLHERLRRGQWIALGLAAIGVLWLTVLAGRPPWIALGLAATFGVYGLMRKVASLGALEGLTLETVILMPFALAVLAWWSVQGTSHFPSDSWSANFWLVASGPITAIPLLLFAAGARRITLATLGVLQYIGPSIQMGLGLWVFKEPFSPERLIGFLMIWAALAVYSAESWWVSRRAAAPATPA